MPWPNEVEAGAEAIYGPEWDSVLDPKGKDAARATARLVLDAAEKARHPPPFIARDVELREIDMRPGGMIPVSIEDMEKIRAGKLAFVGK